MCQYTRTSVKQTNKELTIEIKFIISIVCPHIGAIIGALDFSFEIGMDLWKICTNVDERALARDKFLNMVLFLDSMSNALYNEEYGFFNQLLNYPNTETFQLYKTGVGIYVAIENMIIDYAAEYSHLLQPALKYWNESFFHLVDNTQYVKEFYHARYPNGKTNFRSVNSCWNELNSDMCDDVVQLLRFKHVFIDSEQFIGLKHLYYLTDNEVSQLSDKDKELYAKLITQVCLYSIFCPVNVAIYHDNDLIGTIVNDQVKLNDENVLIYVCEDNDSEDTYKYIALPDGYNVKITGYADGEMSLFKTTFTEDVKANTVVFTDIPVAIGSTYTEENTDGVLSSVNVDLDGDGISDKTVLPYEDEKADSLLGDVNNDGVLNLKDVVLIQRYIAGWNVSIDTSAADYNSDGVINLKDAVLLSRKIAGWKDEKSQVKDSFWQFDTETGVLTITKGSDTDSGIMQDWNESNDTPWSNDCDKIKKIVIADGIKNIGNHAFQNCTNLASVTLPETLSTIGEYAFQGCSQLESISLPGKLSVIGDWAFSDCISLKEIIIPESVSSIKLGAFDCCKILSKITIMNPDCEIVDTTGFTISSEGSDESRIFSGVIVGYSKSSAQKYADTFKRTFSALDQDDDENATPGDATELIPISEPPSSGKTNTSEPDGGKFGMDGIASDYDVSTFPKEVARLVNLERESSNVQKLLFSEKLSDAAQIRAREISEQYSYTRPNGKSSETVLDETGISYVLFTENIGKGYVLPINIMDSWMKSDEASSNILNPDYQYIGVGFYYKDGIRYWVQLFTTSTQLDGNSL